MKDIIVKAYGWLEPADKESLQAVKPILQSWYIEDAMYLEDGALRLSYEGEYFPHEEIAEALYPFLNEQSKGKMDIIDLEAWTLQRYFFDTSLVIVNNVEFSDLARNPKLNSKSKESNSKKSESSATNASLLKKPTIPSRITTLNHVLESCQKK